MKSVTITLFLGLICCAFAKSAIAMEGAKFKESVLYSFCSEQNCVDGTSPVAGLINVKGILYGTAIQGGANCPDEGGCGTVFALDPTTDSERVLYSFCKQPNCVDGWQPDSSLLNIKGQLYGVTYSGGGNNACDVDGLVGCGVVFAVDADTGAEEVLYSFCAKQNCADGATPQASLIAMDGKLYGTTSTGGIGGAGVVFAIDLKSGAEKTVYKFCSQQNCADGAGPTASLIAVNGILYGTTDSGGTSESGTVFALDPKTGVETVLYSFCVQQNCADGSGPWAGLIDLNGSLYGATAYGGVAGCLYGCGTVFAVDAKTDIERVVWSFCSLTNCKDGYYPYSGLINVKGVLYGATAGGGGAGSGGTVYSIDPNSDAENTVYSFCSQQNCTDGEASMANLIDVKGTLYGTTSSGGANVESCGVVGCGTVFALSKKH